MILSVAVVTLTAVVGVLVALFWRKNRELKQKNEAIVQEMYRSQNIIERAVRHGVSRAALLSLAMTLAMKALTMTLALAALTACSSSDDEKNGTEQGTEPTETEETRADFVIRGLCDYDSVRAVYTPIIGKAINEATPTIYYTTAQSVDDARLTYRGIVPGTDNGQTGSGTASGQQGYTAAPDDYRAGDVHLTFAASAAEGEVARITVNCPRLRDVLTSIVFIPESAWPENDDTQAPFNFLSAWRQHSTGRIYVCVRDVFGGEGTMLSFDCERKFTSEHHYTWVDIARRESFVSLYRCMNFNGDKFGAMVKRLGQKAPESTTYALLNRIFNGGELLNFDMRGQTESWFGHYHVEMARFCKEWYYLNTAADPTFEELADYHGSTDFRFGQEYVRDDNDWTPIVR